MNAGAPSVITLSPGAVSYSDPTSSNNTYTYYVEATNLLGTVASDPISIATSLPSAPTIVLATVPTQTSVTITWTHNATTETGFKVMRKVGNGTPTLLATIANKATRSHTDTGRSSGQSLQYQVRAYNSMGDGPLSPLTPSPALVMAKPAIPTGVVAKILSPTQVEVSWNDTSNNENGFKLWRKTGAGTPEPLPTTGPGVTKYVDPSVNTGPQYTYQVASTNAFGDSAIISGQPITMLTPTAPGALKATLVAANRVDLSWTDSDTETSYVITRAADGVDFSTRWDLVAGATSFSDTTVLSNLTYTYRVSAVNGMGSTTSTVAMAIKPPVAPLTLTGQVASSSQINLAWTVAPDSTHTSFKIQEKTGTGAFVDVTSPAATARTYSRTGRSTGATYTYKIFAVNGAGSTVQATPDLVITMAAPSAPSGLVAKVASSSQVTLTWNQVSTNETGFRVQRCNGTSTTCTATSGSWTTIPATSSPPLPADTKTYTVPSLTGNTNYSFRVFATSGAGNSGNSNIVSTNTSSPAAAPTTLVAATISMNQVRLTWNDTTTNESGFAVERSPNGTTGWSKVGETDQNIKTYDDINLTANTPYWYRVYPFNGIPRTPPLYSNVATVSTPASCAGQPIGMACNDGNLCTTNDTCQAGGVCVGGPPVTCSGGTACSTFTCDAMSGQCKPAHKPLGTTCNDSNLCTNGDVCNGAGVCGGVAKSCSDGNACTADTCEAATGTCRNTASTCSVTPLAACTMLDGSGGTVAVFGYASAASDNVEMVHGPDNQMTPPEYQGRQPRWFKPGTQQAAFTFPIAAAATVSWKIGSQTVSATSGTAPCSQDVRDKANDQLFVDPTAALAASIVSPATVGTTATLASIGGDVEVTAEGGASYSVPLEAPAGRRGIEPNLSLEYNSNNRADGFLGVGWRLGGLSGIHRCARTVGQDGDASPVKYNDDDAICLDGARLVLVQGTGGSDSEYRTEGESHLRVFRRLAAYGLPSEAPKDPGGGDGLPRPQRPAWYFEVYSPDGQIRTFGFPNVGSDAFARQAYFNPQPFSAQPELPAYRVVQFDWPMTSVRDRFGNAMDVSYKSSSGSPEDGYTFSRVPDLITYTHHRPTTGAPRPGGAMRAVRFKYDPRTAGFSAARFTGGVRVSIASLLTSVEMFAPPYTLTSATSKPLRAYKLTYRPGQTQGNLLESLTECVEEHCRPATTVEYTTPGQWSEAKDVGIGLADLWKAPGGFDKYRWTDLAHLAVGDINGDGRDDLAYAIGEQLDQKLVYHVSVGETFGPPIVTAIPDGARTAGRPSLMDIDGDGRAEVGLFRSMLDPTMTSNSARWFMDYCRVAGGSCQRINADGPQSWDRYPGIGNLLTLPGDVNGDGLPEFLRTWVTPHAEPSLSPVYLELRRNVGGVLQPYNVEFSDNLLVQTTPLHGGLEVVETMDLDGDGAQEVLFAASAANRVLSSRRVRSSGVEGAALTNIRKSGYGPNWFVDLNGDGLKDLVYLGEYAEGGLGVHRLKTQMNVGTGFSVPVTHAHLDTSKIPFNTRSRSRDDDNIRIVDVNQDGAEELLLVDAGPYAPGRSSLTTIRMGADGWLWQASLPITVGAHANGPAGSHDYSNCGESWGPKGLMLPVGDCYVGQFEPGLEPYGHHLSQVLDINGDGLDDFIKYDEATNRLLLHVRRDAPGDILKAVRKGYGRGSFEVDYASIAQQGRGHERALYDAGSCAGGEFACVRGGRWVVSEIRRLNAAPHPDLVSIYSYKDGRSSRNGAGFLGFGERWEETLRQDAIGLITTERHLKYRSFEKHGRFYPLVGVPEYIETFVRKFGADRIEHRTVTTVKHDVFLVAGGARYELWPAGTNVSRQETNLRSGQTALVQDLSEHRERSALGYGRVEYVRRDIVSGSQFQGTEILAHDAFMPDSDALKLVGPPTRVRRESFSYTSSTAAPPRITTYSFDPTTLMVSTIVRSPEGGADERLTTTVTPTTDGTGQVAQVATQGGGEARVVRYGYDSLEAMYPQTTTDALGMSNVAVFHPALDAPVISRDVNGVTTRYVQDLFGRMQKHDMPPGVADTTVRHLENPLRIEVSVAGGPSATRTLDEFGRWTRTDITYGGGISRRVREYDILGRPHRSSAPHTPGASSYFTEVQWDEMGRVIQIEAPTEEGRQFVERHRYSGTKITSLDAEDNPSEVVLDGFGRVVRSSQLLYEDDGSTKNITADYVHGPFGLMDSVNIRPSVGGPALLTTSFQYDSIGRLKTTSDSNRGSSSTTYTPFDEVLTTTDAGGILVSNRYDVLGRLKERIAPEGSTMWQYDTALNGLGRLHSSVSPEGVSDTLSYDPLGRTRSSRSGVAGQTFEFDYQYDSTFGRLEKLSYPTTPGWPRLEVSHRYRATGELEEIVRGDTGASLWKANALDAAGRVTQESLGQLISAETIYSPRTGRVTNINADAVGTGGVLDRLSYAYHSDGNLARRTDSRLSESPIYEYFEYDSLDRLRTWQEGTQSGLPRADGWKVDYKYSETGNLERRTTSAPGRTAQTATFGHGVGANAGPNALTSWTFSGGGVPGVDPQAFGYDASRRVSSHPRVGTIQYNSFDLPTRISGATVTAQFGYDGSGTRAYKHEDFGGGRVNMTHYAGLYEMRTRLGASPADSVEHVLHLVGGTGGIGQISRRSSMGQLSETTTFYTRDHLGSIRSVVSSDGVIERRRTDPFGNAVVDPAFPVLDTTSMAMSSVDRRVTDGFTGHEEDQSLGLINMRGRIYEPLAGKFLSPDPFVSSITATQAWNAYSYVRNSPLNRVDPTGFIDINRYKPEPPPVFVLEGFAAYLQACASHPSGGASCAGDLADMGEALRNEAAVRGEGEWSVSETQSVIRASDGENAANAEAGTVIGANGEIYITEKATEPSVWDAIISNAPILADLIMANEAFKNGDNLEGVLYSLSAIYDAATLPRALAQSGAKIAGKAVLKQIKKMQQERAAREAAEAAAKSASTAAKSAGTAGGSRAGKSFTPKGKAEIDAKNAAKNEGKNVCENCGVEVVPGKRSERGVTPPTNERQRDHIIPKSKGGDGDPSNGQILCRGCNNDKSDN